MTDFNQKTHDTDVGSHGGQSRQMMEVFENQEFGSIRLLQEAGKTFFCASDVAKALGYVNPYAAVKRHCRDPLTKREEWNRSYTHHAFGWTGELHQTPNVQIVLPMAVCCERSAGKHRLP